MMTQLDADSFTAYVKYIFLDIVEYTKSRSVEVQSEIISILNTIVISAVESAKVDPENVIYIPTGDGICVAIVDTLRPYDLHLLIAKSILHNLSKHNKSVELDFTRVFQVRIGVNECTDNIVQDINGRRNVSGQGINMSQRIMSCGDGGQILVGQSVFDNLSPRQKYLKSFKKFYAIGKHDLRFDVFQYVNEDAVGLNNEIPNEFKRRLGKSAQKLSRYQGYYFAFAQLNFEYFFTHKDDVSQFSSAIVLLHMLSSDACEKHQASKFGTLHPITWGAGVNTFEEQFDHYCNEGIEIILELSNLIKKYYLNDYSSFFEKGEFNIPSFIFLNDTGRKKLLDEYPDIINELGVDFWKK